MQKKGIHFSHAFYKPSLLVLLKKWVQLFLNQERVNLPRATIKITGRSPVPLSILWRRVLFPRDRLCHSNRPESVESSRESGERVSPVTKVELSFARVALFSPLEFWILLHLRMLHDKTQDRGLCWHSRVRKWMCVCVCVDMFPLLDKGGHTAVLFAAGEVPPHPLLHSAESWQCRQNTGTNYLPE